MYGPLAFEENNQQRSNNYCNIYQVNNLQENTIWFTSLQPSYTRTLSENYSRKHIFIQYNQTHPVNREQTNYYS